MGAKIFTSLSPPFPSAPPPRPPKKKKKKKKLNINLKKTYSLIPQNHEILNVGPYKPNNVMLKCHAS